MCLIGHNIHYDIFRGVVETVAHSVIFIFVHHHESLLQKIEKSVGMFGKDYPELCDKCPWNLRCVLVIRELYLTASIRRGKGIGQGKTSTEGSKRFKQQK